MPTDTQRNSMETQPISASGKGIPPPARRSLGEGGAEEFLSLRDIVIMILRHRRAIAVFVILVTIAAGIFFVTRPRQYEAEGYLQVIPPASQEGRVDKELFETMIVSYLQKASSAYIAKNVAALLNDQGCPIKPLELEKQVTITRPPRTDLIRLVVAAKSADKALLIVRLWVREYLSSIQNNNIHAALSQTRSLLKQAQSELMEKQATVDAIKIQVAQSSPLITLTRAVDDRQIWSDLAQKTPLDPEALKKLAEIHIQGQEQSEVYINLKKAMLIADEALSSVLARRNLYQKVERSLEARIALNGSYKDDKTMSTNTPLSEAEFYVSTLLKSSEIVQFGEPGQILTSRKVLKNTGLVFLASLGFTCLCAFLCEWGKGLLSA